MQDAVGDTNNAFEQYTQSDEFRVQRGINAWENFKTSVGSILLGFVSSVADIFVTIGEQIMGVVNMILGGWTNLVTSITDLLGITSEETRNNTELQVSYWEKLYTFLSVVWSAIVGVIQGVFGTITELISDFVI